MPQHFGLRAYGSGMDDGLSPGKPSPELLFGALRTAAATEVRQGPGPGRDAAVVEWRGEALVAAADPITFVDANAGRLAVAVNANDIYALGADPRWLLATVLVPPGTAEADLSALLADLAEACRGAGIDLIGGHTEVSDAVRRAVVSCAMLGSAPLGQIVPSDGARAGDVLIQAGRCAVEGTALLVSELRDWLLGLDLPAGLLDRAAQLSEEPGISIREAAIALRSLDGVHAMHDVTEGGIATAARELSDAAGVGVELRAEAILWHPETTAICSVMGLDRLGLLGSGTLLAAVVKEEVDGAIAALRSRGIAAAAIGRITAGGQASLIGPAGVRELPRWDRDEALRGLGEARSGSGEG